MNQQLRSVSPFALIDIRYNSTHHLNNLWHHPGDMPLLFEWIQEKGYPVIHVVRDTICKNELGKIIGENNAVVLNTLSPENQASVDQQPHRPLPVTRVLKNIGNLDRQIKLFRRWLEPLDIAEVRYDELSADNRRFSPVIQKRIWNLLSIADEVDLKVARHGLDANVETTIENFDSEIKRH